MQTAIIQYFIESALCLSMFALWYHFTLRKTNLFTLRTIFLFSAPVLSLSIPLLQISNLFQQDFQFGLKLPFSNRNIDDNGLAFVQESANQVALSLADLLFVIYILGLAIGLIIVAKRILAYLKLSKQNAKRETMTVKPGIVDQPKFSKATWSQLNYYEASYNDFPWVDQKLRDSFQKVHILPAVLLDIFQAFTWFIPLSLYLRRQYFLLQFQKFDAFLSGLGQGKTEYSKQIVRLFTAELFEEKRHFIVPRLIALESKSNAVKQGLKYVGTALFLSVLLLVFSIQKKGELAQSETILTELSRNISKAFYADLFVLKQWEAPPPKMVWAGQEIPLTVIDQQTAIQFQVHVFNSEDFLHFQKEIPFIFEADGTPIIPKFVRISVAGNDHLSYYNTECSDGQFDCLHLALNDMQAKSSIQLVFGSEKFGQLYCILTDESETLYIPQYSFIEDPFIFDPPKTLKSYGVEKMSRMNANYQFVWGAYLKFNIHQKSTHQITKDELIQAIKNMPGLSPIHGGMFEDFSFFLNVIDLNERQTSVFVEISDRNDDAYYHNKLLQDLINGLDEGNQIYLDHFMLGDKKISGSVAMQIVDVSSKRESNYRPNFANFNYIRNSFGTGVGEEKEENRFILKWGTYFIPLKLFASPNQFKGKLEIEPEAFKDIIKYPLEVLQNQDPIDPDSIKRFLSLNYFEGTGFSSRNTFAFNDQGEIKLSESAIEKLINLNPIGLNYSVSGVLGDIQLNGLDIQFIDPDGPFLPPINLLKPNQYFGEEFSFQVIQGFGQEKTVIKLDSLAPGSAHIINMYRDKSKYTVIQIPGFKTRRRLVTPDLNTLYSTPKKLSQDVFSLYNLKEFVLSDAHSIEARWGKMIASPVSGNYSVREFRSSAKQGFSFIIDSKLQKVVQAEIKVFSDDRLTHHFITQNLNNEIIRRTLQNVQSRGSVYISNLLIEDESGKEVLIVPQDFAFIAE